MRIRATMIVIVLAAPAASESGAKPFSTTYKGKYAEVDISWSAEVSQVPTLVRRFRREFASEKAQSIKCGKIESEVRGRTGDEAMRCSSSTTITTKGETPRLLSLARAYWAFTGGAHGNGATHGLLWDRAMNREISFASLFTSPRSITTLLRQPYCKALDAERKKRRGPDYTPGGIAEFNSCPKLLDLALMPASSARSGRFDQIRLIAAPYQAGSFAEGEYDIAPPITSPVIAAIKPAYRASFRAQRQ